MAQLTDEISDFCPHCNQPIFIDEMKRPPIVFNDGELGLYPLYPAVAVDGVRTHLTPLEFKVLYFLGTRAGKVCSKDTIFMCVWGDSDVETKITDVLICKIRKKLNAAKPGLGDRAILTHWGRGYSFGTVAAIPVTE